MVKSLLLALLVFLLPLSATARDIGEAELQQIAGLIFHNECAARESCLTSWNEGEQFASLGIGHFIWYPAGSEKPFSESFPALLLFMEQQGVTLPGWLSDHPTRPNPWPDRSHFMAASQSASLSELRQLLIETKSVQAQFMLLRFEQALPDLLAGLNGDREQHIRKQFERVAKSPMGMYALIDYVNFKGEGSNPKERYHGKGWGLLQVLEHMQGRDAGLEAIEAFADSADMMLTRRVSLSPAERNESRWLSGWRKRLSTYVAEARALLEQAE
ncbi:hypothetical protein [Mariprofundus sp. KV]|uniref:hypothetical protein n=1 Tax=Mariprofundus sp. KV TaxID=2608715 RepID=UPI0015A122BB|nr:hypothetical protein [Mariprofundus sp. KV]NWF35295.1 hypothetical protein [Mariprofundus sp. KV]